MKYIEFTKEANLQFSCFYTALSVVTDKTPLDNKTTRLHAKIMDNIESNARKPIDGDDVYRLPEDKGLILSFEDNQFDLVKTIVQNFPFAPKYSRDVVKLYDMVESPLDKHPDVNLVKDGENGVKPSESQG